MQLDPGGLELVVQICPVLRILRVVGPHDDVRQLPSVPPPTPDTMALRMVETGSLRFLPDQIEDSPPAERRLLAEDQDVVRFRHEPDQRIPCYGPECLLERRLAPVAVGGDERDPDRRS